MEHRSTFLALPSMLLAAAAVLVALHPLAAEASEGDCCASNGTPGCDDAACESVVCATDSYCCTTAWDSICASAAQTSCAVCAPNTKGDCCADNLTPGCTDYICESTVCASDLYCCDVAWDSICVNAAQADCATCTNPAAGDCCTATNTPGCEARSCEAKVCKNDSYCCDTSWDSVCATTAQTTCSVCPAPAKGKCCEANGTPGCENASCEAKVCKADSFCCTVAWDNICANSAKNACTLCGCSPQAGDFTSAIGLCDPSYWNPQVKMCTFGDLAGSLAGEYLFIFDTMEFSPTLDRPNRWEYTGRSFIDTTTPVGSIYANDTGWIEFGSDVRQCIIDCVEYQSGQPNQSWDDVQRAPELTDCRADCVLDNLGGSEFVTSVHMHQGAGAWSHVTSGSLIATGVADLLTNQTVGTYVGSTCPKK